MTTNALTAELRKLLENQQVVTEDLMSGPTGTEERTEMAVVCGLSKHIDAVVKILTEQKYEFKRHTQTQFVSLHVWPRKDKRGRRLLNREQRLDLLYDLYKAVIVDGIVRSCAGSYVCHIVAAILYGGPSPCVPQHTYAYRALHNTYDKQHLIWEYVQVPGK